METLGAATGRESVTSLVLATSSTSAGPSVRKNESEVLSSLFVSETRVVVVEEIEVEVIVTV